MQQPSNTLQRAFIAAAMLFPLAAQAHHAEFMSDRPLLQGMSMPIHGVDHLLSAIAIGVLAGRLGGDVQWKLPTVFSVLSILGGLSNLSGFILPDWCIPVSAALIASLLLINIPATGIAVALVACAGIFNGQALLSSPPSGWSAAVFSVGCVTSALILCFCGVLVGRRLQNSPLTARIAGAVLVAGITTVSVFPSINDIIIRLVE